MQLPVLCILFLSLVLMMREDYLYRAISIKYILVFIVGAGTLGVLNAPFSQWITHVGINIGLLIFLLLIMQLYYWLRFKQRGWFVDKVMGKGDLLFFLALALVFSPLNFLMSVSFLSLLSIFLSLPTIIKNGVAQRLPLITYMGLGLVIESMVLYKYDVVFGSDAYLIAALVNG